jgi:hypothetical protein
MQATLAVAQRKSSAKMEERPKGRSLGKGSNRQPTTNAGREETDKRILQERRKQAEDQLIRAEV